MTKTQLVLEIARNVGVIRAKDIASRGIHPSVLQHLEQQGLLIRSGRGLYTSMEADITEHHSLIEAVKRVPSGVICLLSALSFYELTSQAPFKVWMAIPQKARHPKDNLIPLRIVYMSGEALNVGIEEHRIEGITVRVYCIAKTVVDCFKYRNKIGLDVALEALRQCWLKQRCSIDEIWRYARFCRMENVIRPYLDTLE